MKFEIYGSSFHVVILIKTINFTKFLFFWHSHNIYWHLHNLPTSQVSVYKFSIRIQKARNLFFILFFASVSVMQLQQFWLMDQQFNLIKISGFVIK